MAKNYENNGRDGELLAKTYLENQGYKVIDVSSNKDYWSKDIDLIAEKDGKTFAIEVKWDNLIYKTGNMFIETYTNLDIRQGGWISFCKADYLYYGSSRERKFYICSVKDIQQYISETSLQERKAPDYNYRGEVKKVSQGKLLPIKDFSRQYPVQVVYV